MRSSKHLLRSMCAIGAGLLMSASAGMAQGDWEAFYNPNNSVAAARGGVLHFLDNSSIAVGEAIQNGSYDVLVTHQPANGCWNPDWQYTYNISGNDIGRKIRKTSDGGYIVVGTTAFGCYNNDIFLMKLTSTGAVSWVRTYGGTNIEEGRDVQQLSDGGYIIAGSTFSAGAGGRDAYLIRTNSTGVQTWGYAYGNTGDEYLLSVEVAGTGDYIATGGTSSNTVGGTDILLLRVNPATGVANIYSNYGTTSNDGAWRAIEIASGNIAICGYSRGFGGNAEGIILTVTGAGAYVNGHYYGGSTGGWDEFLDITQLSGGDLMVTGIAHLPSGGMGGYDIYVGRVNNVTLAPVSQLLFGNEGDDHGWAITKSGSGNADGWMVAGLSNSRYTNNIETMYVISRPNMNRRFCQDAVPNITHNTAAFTRLSPAHTKTLFAISCASSATRADHDSFVPGCGDCLPSATAPAERNGLGIYEGTDADTRIVPGGENNSVSSVDESVDASAALYPNPVRSGSSFTVALPAGSRNADIVISDMAGKVVHSGTVEGMETPIATDGWAAGVYVIRLNRGTGVEMKRVVVTD